MQLTKHNHTCGHCGNTAPMQVIFAERYEQLYGEHIPEENIIAPSTTYHWNIYACISCGAPTVFQAEVFSEADDNVIERTLYPSNKKFTHLPDSVLRSYELALKVYSTDPNLFAVQIGKVLEFICEDRSAKGRDLSSRLNDLAARGEFPQRVLDMAHSLRAFRNIGGHASKFEINKYDAETIKKVCEAILEYVYEAPAMLTEIQESLPK